MSRAPAALALGGLLALVLFAACGGGGGGGGPTAPPPPPPPQSGVFFTADATAGDNTIVLRAPAGAGATTLDLDVRASSVQELFGLAFDLVFPTGALIFDSAEEGTFLSAEGAFATAFEVQQRPAGNLVVGLTRLGKVKGASGSGVLLTLHFTAKMKTVEKPLSFANNQGFDRKGEPLVDLTWIAGSVRIVP